MENYIRSFITIVRYLLPVLSVLLLSCCAIGLLRKNRYSFKVKLVTDNKKEFRLCDGEYIVGSGKDCDITVSGLDEKHFVISVCSKSFWLRPISKAKLSVNGRLIKEEASIKADDVITARKREFSFYIKNSRTKGHNNSVYKATAACALTLIQFFIMLSLIFAFPSKSMVIFAVFAAFTVFSWVHLTVTRFSGAFIEIPVMFLVTIGFSVVAHKTAGIMIKQLICVALGVIGAILLSKVISLPRRAVNLRKFVFILGVVLFSLNMVFGVIYNGAQNWLNIAGFSFQPSELIKVIIIFICGASVEKLDNLKDSLFFMVFSVFCLFSLAYLGDFGTSIIYAVVFITVITLRFCSIKLLAFLGGITVVLSVAVVVFFPYVARRVFSFGQAWANAYGSGYQQTRAMVATASGGLFGIGGGKGRLIKIPAADTDIVFGLISEEFGLIISFCVLFCFVLFALFAIKVLYSSKSAYYGITASAASVLLLVQAALNVFGTLDMLPFTGVTLPFVSNGGSSVISCLMLTAFFRTPLVCENSAIKTEGRKSR